MQRVLSITSVEINIDNHVPPHVLIHVQGKVTSTGWSNPGLEPWRYIRPPEDGVQDFDFVAEPPRGITNPVISPIAASLHVPVDIENYWGAGKPLKGVRIHSQTNSMTAALEDATPMEAAFEQNAPFPWDIFKIDLKPGSVEAPISSLVGHEARVYHAGDPVTLDFRPQRINIVLESSGTRIGRVYFG